MPNHNGPSAFQCNPFNNKTAALLSTSNAHSNFMYANWIDVHAKTPDQTNYLFCLQGNWFQFQSFSCSIFVVCHFWTETLLLPPLKE